MKRPSLAGAALVGVFAVAAILVSPGPAMASHVQCGDVVTTNVKLDSDLLLCPGSGIVVGADGITIDLNGHRIGGTGLTDSGVDDEGHDGIVVENGAIDGFQHGVNLDEGADHNLVQNLVLHTNLFSITVYDSSFNVVQDNTITGFFGVDLTEAIGNVVQRNAIVGVQIGVGIYLFPGSDDNVVSRNSARNMLFGVLLFDSDRNRVDRTVTVENEFGIALVGSEGSDDVLLQRNTSRRNGKDGILAAVNSHNVVVDRNLSEDNGDNGIVVSDPTDTVVKNIANDNDLLGIRATAGVTDGGGNRAAGNGDARQCVNVVCN
jgi:parallel beta-helix repeat protein